MKITIDQPSFNQLLNRCYPAVETLTTIPILGNFLLDARADGTLQVSATDLQLGIRSIEDCRTKEPGLITLPAAKLRAIVSSLPESDIAIETDDRNAAILKCAKSKHKIAGMSAESFPALPVAPPPTLEIGANQLARMVSRTAFAINPQEGGRFTLAGALMVVEDGEFRVVATDGHRMAYVTLAANVANNKLIVPLDLMRAAKAGSDGQVSIGHDDNHVYLSSGSTVMIGRKIAGTFPDYLRVLPRKEGILAVASRVEFKRMLDSVNPLADKGTAKGDSDTGVILRFSSGQIAASTRGRLGEAEASMDATYDGPDVEIGFTSRYLSEFLDQAVTDTVHCFVVDGKSAMEMRPSENGYRYVVMPRRI